MSSDLLELGLETERQSFVSSMLDHGQAELLGGL